MIIDIGLYSLIVLLGLWGLFYLYFFMLIFFDSTLEWKSYDKYEEAVISLGILSIIPIVIACEIYYFMHTKVNQGILLILLSNLGYIILLLVVLWSVSKITFPLKKKK